MGGDYRTIQAAVDDLPSPGPRIVKVRAGTYPEAVKISRKNTAAIMESQRIVLMADPEADPGAVVVTPPRDKNTFSIDLSKFVTLKGFRLTGATREGIYVRGGLSSTSRDVTLDGNLIHHNGSSSASGGIFVGRENPRTRVVNNLIYANGRDGVTVECGLQGAPKYFVNNTVVQNGFNGFNLGDAASDQIFLVNNLIVANGLAPGTTGGRFGVLRESAAPAAGPGFRSTIFLHSNMFYRNTAADIGNINQTLDATDSGNRITKGTEAASCLGPAPGCPLAIAGCTFPDCGTTTHDLTEIFLNPAGADFDFGLAQNSPAINAGLTSFINGGTERVPARDVDGDPRPVGVTIDVGFDQLP